MYPYFRGQGQQCEPRGASNRKLAMHGFAVRSAEPTMSGVTCNTCVSQWIHADSGQFTPTVDACSDDSKEVLVE